MKNKTGSFDILISDFDERFFKVDFPERFNEAMLDAVRSVPGRIWNQEKRLWLIPYNKTAASQLLNNIYTTGLYNVDEKSEYTPDCQSKPQSEKYIALFAGIYAFFDYFKVFYVFGIHTQNAANCCF